MQRSLLSLLLLGSILPSRWLPAQMHKVARPEQVVRAVGVYEWTGDLKKPSASRLIPVTVFIDGALQDAGVYLPRPIPFALSPGNEYELQQAGTAQGTLDLAYARHLQTTDLAYEDGWFGYGSYKAPPPPKKETALRTSRTPAVLTSSKDDGRPHFSGKGDADAKPAGSDPAKDPQTADSSAGSRGKSSTDPNAPDPDRPTMRRRGDTTTAAPAPDTTASSPDNNPSNDADRPTLRRRSPDDAKKAKDKGNDVATVTGTGSLNNDPDRPKLQRGGRSTAGDTDMPKLVGVPKDLKQMVAVSDAASRPTHDFALPFPDEKERTAILEKMRVLARAQLRIYAQASPASSPAVTPAKGPKNPTATRRPAARTTLSKSPAAPPFELLDEQLKAYTLSYGGAPTYVYTAHTAGTGADLRYVTLVAQADNNGELQPAVRSTTDEAHLDRTPRMHFVDVVDAEASNRASLLFELRAQSTRQFALLRVIGSRPETIFTTGTTQ